MEAEELRNKERRLSILKKLEQEGVFIFDPEHTYIEDGVKIGKNTHIYPYVFIYSRTIVGERCMIWPFNVIIGGKIGNCVVIESFSKIESAEIGDFVTIRSHSKIADGSKIGDGCKVGPHANLPPGTILL